MRLVDRARQARAQMQIAGKFIPDEIAKEMPTFFDAWKVREYAKDEKVRYNDTLYKCLQAHTAQADWAPDVSPSLWVRIDNPAIEYPDWIQPLGAHDAYPIGAKVTHKGKKWTSITGANIWEPGVYGWEEKK